MRQLMRNLLLVTAIAVTAGLLAPSSTVVSVPGLVLDIDDVVDWSDPIPPRNTTSNVHMLFVRNVELPWLVAEALSVLDPTDVRSGAPESVGLEKSQIEANAVARAVAYAQARAGIQQDVRIRSAVLLAPIPGTLPYIANVPMGAHIDGIDGVDFDDWEDFFYRVHELSAREHAITLRGTTGGPGTPRATWVAASPPGPFAGDYLLGNTDLMVEVAPRSLQLLPHEGWSGSSISLAVALAIHERYTLPGPLPYPVCATGAVLLGGGLDTVNGMDQKLRAAERRGCRVAMLPWGPDALGAEERAAEAGLDLTVVQVKSVDEATGVLDAIAAGEFELDG